MNATIEFGLLWTFVEVSERESFTETARTLGTTTATVSRDIARLEDLVGSRLFHRTTRSVSLTTTGETLYARVEAHVRALQTAVGDLPEQQDEPAGLLRLTAPYDLGATVLGPLIARFMARYPRVRIQASFSSHFEDLSAGGFDVAIRADASGLGESWRATELVRAGGLGWFASPNYLERVGTPTHVGAQDHRWLIAAPLRRYLDFPADIEPAAEANDFLFLREMAAAGAGVTTLPDFITTQDIVDGRLTRVLSHASIRTGSMSLVYPAQEALAPKISAFRDFLSQHLPAWAD